MTPDHSALIERLDHIASGAFPHVASVGSVVAEAASALRDLTEWRDIATAPKDGTPFYARHQSPFRFQPYKPGSPQQRDGLAGRWQAMNEWGGWDNCPAPSGDWKPHPDFDLPSAPNQAKALK